MMAGLELPPIEQWRVLEIACGDGSNILPLAFDYPEGRFIGVDRARNPIEAGRALAARLQLTNIVLQDADLLEWQPEGVFDYIVAHGIYSWVRDEIREKILRICGNALKPKGVAFVSYNALPGCHFRRYAWDFLRFHVKRQTDPDVRVEKARALARLIASRPESDDALQQAVRSEMETVLKRDETVLYHDDLSEINEPFYLLDFVSQAESHGLQYLGDAEPVRDDVRDLPLQAEDWIESRQYGDFLAKRRFRETLLCRRGIPLDRKLSLDRFRNVFAASRVTPGKPQKDGQQKFGLPKSGNLTTNHPLAKEMLCQLASLWPGSMRISEFTLDEHPPDSVTNLLMQLVQAGALELRIHPPKIAVSIGDHPAASALARAQVAEGYRMVTNQRHNNIAIGDEISRRILALLDGSRDRGELIRDLLASGMDPDAIHRNLEPGLAGLHHLCLLTG
jgi:methyltransferase-like protein/ubiquinone/menaquinone biosynthesis C-methylase UbiE